MLITASSQSQIIEVQSGEDRTIQWHYKPSHILHSETEYGRKVDVQVTFEKEFTRVPEVLISLRKISAIHAYPQGYELSLIDVTTTGFTYRATAYTVERVHGLEMYWLAHTDPNLKINYVNQLQTTELQQGSGERSQLIDVKFTSDLPCENPIANVFLLGGNSVSGSQELRVKVESVSQSGIKIKTFANFAIVNWISFSTVASCPKAMENIRLGYTVDPDTVNPNEIDFVISDGEARIASEFRHEIQNIDLIPNGFIFQGLTEVNLQRQADRFRPALRDPAVADNTYSIKLISYQYTRGNTIQLNGFVYSPQNCVVNECVKLNGRYYPRVCLDQNFDLRSQVTDVQNSSEYQQDQRRVKINSKLVAVDGQTRSPLSSSCFTHKLFAKDGQEYTKEGTSTLESIDFVLPVDYILNSCSFTSGKYLCEFDSIYYINNIVQYVIDLSIYIAVDIQLASVIDVEIQSLNREFNIEGDKIEVSTTLQLFPDESYTQSSDQPLYTLGDYMYAQVKLVDGFLGKEFDLSLEEAILFSVDQQTEIPLKAVESQSIVQNGTTLLRLKFRALFAGQLRLSVKSKLTERVNTVIGGGNSGSGDGVRRQLNSISYDKSYKYSKTNATFDIKEESQANNNKKDSSNKNEESDNKLVYVIIIVSVCAVVAISAVIGGVICYKNKLKLKASDANKKNKYTIQQSIGSSRELNEV